MLIDELPGLEMVSPRDKHHLRMRFCNMSGLDFRRPGFPGSRAIRFEHSSLENLKREPYMVTVNKSKTFRVMMLVEKMDRIYVTDRYDDIYKLEGGLNFPLPSGGHHSNTLLEGVLYMKESNGDQEKKEKEPMWFFVQDIAFSNNKDMKMLPYFKRYDAIMTDIIKPRTKINGELKRNHMQPFYVGRQEFYDVKKMKQLLSPKFLKSLDQVPDGYLFCSKTQRYTAGKNILSMIWRPEVITNVDFRLVIEKKPSKKEAHLMVWNHKFLSKYADMKYSEELDDFDGKIVECALDPKTSEWTIVKERLEKRNPDTPVVAHVLEMIIRDPITEEKLMALIEKHCHTEVLDASIKKE